MATRQKSSIIGCKFGRLTVIRDSGKRSGTATLYYCQCRCGGSTITTSTKLKSGHTSSCGCYKLERIKQSTTGQNNRSWKGGSKNTGSEAWASRILSSGKFCAKRNGYSGPAGEPDDIIKLWHKSGGKCAICYCQHKLHLDHDHTTGRLRGFICSYCNAMLGFAKDDSRTLERAIGYLNSSAVTLVSCNNHTYTPISVRICECGSEIKGHKAKCCQQCYRSKRSNHIPDRDTLQKLVWTEPSTEIARRFGVSDVAIGKWCKKLGIKKPGIGYWNKST